MFITKATWYCYIVSLVRNEAPKNRHINKFQINYSKETHKVDLLAHTNNKYTSNWKNRQTFSESLVNEESFVFKVAF